MKEIFRSKCFGGTQGIYAHRSEACACDMRFSVFIPPGLGAVDRAPVLYWLSGLTCTEENFIIKSGAQALAAGLGLILVAPDTSPRGEGVPDDAEGAYDFGLGAGFYVDATEAPWAAHYKMHSYVARELPALIGKEFPIDPGRAGVFGHSMGGHGALTMHLKYPETFRTCSAFAPIVAPSQVPWGRKAFSNYLGSDETAWAEYDATALVAARPSAAEILIDQGGADEYLAKQLRPELFAAAAQGAGQKLTLRMQAGYDHSYYFISTFMEDHLRWHRERLAAR